MKIQLITTNPGAHVIITGPCGAGKSAGPVLGTLLNSSDSIIVNDRNGELFLKSAGWRSRFSDIAVYAPWGPYSKDTVQINPLLDIAPGLESIKQSDVVAKALISREDFAHLENSENHYKFSVKLITGALLYLLHGPKTHEPHLGQLPKFLNSQTGRLLKNCKISIPAAADVSQQEELFNLNCEINAWGENLCAPCPEAKATITVLTKIFKKFQSPKLEASFNQPNYSLRSFLTQYKTQTLYFIYHQEQWEVSFRLQKVFFELTSRILMEEPPQINIREAQKRRRAALKNIGKSNTFNSHKPLKTRRQVTLMIEDIDQYPEFITLHRATQILRSYQARMLITANSLEDFFARYGSESDLLHACTLKLFLGVKDLPESELVAAELFRTVNNNTYTMTGAELNILYSLEAPAIAVPPYTISPPVKLKPVNCFNHPELKKCAAVRYHPPKL